MILLAGTHQVDKADLEFKDINLPHRLSTVTPDLNICTNPLRISYMHINVSWSYSLLLLLIPPTSIPPPYFMSFFFFFLNNQLNPSCAAHILTGVGSSWSTYWPTRRTPLKKTTTPYPRRVSPGSSVVRDLESFPTSCWNVDWLDCVQATTGDGSSRLQQSCLPDLRLQSHSPPIPFSGMVPESTGWFS